MKEAIKLLAAPTLGFLGGYISYWIQFRRNRKIDSRSKVKLAIRLLNDVIKDTCETEEKYQAALKAIDNEPYILPSIKMDFHPAVKMLVELIHSESYQIAFGIIFKNILRYEEQFYSLLSHSWKLKQVLDNVNTICTKTETYIDSHLNKIIEHTKIVIKTCRTFCRTDDQTKAPAQDQIRIIIDHYNTTANDLMELHELESIIVNPLKEFFEKNNLDHNQLANIEDMITNIEQSLIEIKSDIQSFASDLKDRIDDLISLLRDLEKNAAFFNELYVKQLYL